MYMKIVFVIIFTLLTIVFAEKEDDSRIVKNNIVPWSKYKKKFFPVSNAKKDSESFPTQQRVKLYLPPFRQAKKQHISEANIIDRYKDDDVMSKNSNFNVRPNYETVSSKETVVGYTPTFAYKNQNNNVKEVPTSVNTNLQGATTLSKLPSFNNGLTFPIRPELNNKNNVQDLKSKELNFEVEIPKTVMTNNIPMLPTRNNNFPANISPRHLNNFANGPLFVPKQNSALTFTGNSLPAVDPSQLANSLMNIPHANNHLITPTFQGIDNSLVSNSIMNQRFLAPPPSPINPSIFNGEPFESATSGIKKFFSEQFAFENLSKIARNWFQNANSNPDFLKSFKNQIKDKGLVSSALPEVYKSESEAVKKSEIDEEDTDTETATDKSETSTTDEGLQIDQTTPKSLSNTTKEARVHAAIKGIPIDQQEMLEKAFASGELDEKTLLSWSKELKLDNFSQNGTSSKEDNKLINWIQQNRPKLNTKETALSSITNDKLPYYGKYCGTFTQNTKIERSGKNIVGAVWAVDDRRFLISKFYFQQGNSLDNITFWIGPKVPAHDYSDIQPSLNGYYVAPQLVEFTAFVTKKRRTLRANIREPIAPIQSKIEVKEYTKNETLEHVYDDENETFVSNKDIIGMKIDEPFARLRIARNANIIRLDPTKDNTLKNSEKIKEEYVESEIKAIVNTPVSRINPNKLANRENEMTTLEWYAGFQPLLLALPDNKLVRTSNWISIWDHKRNVSLASVWIPNGPAFIIPSMIFIKELAPLGLHKVSSGLITILDTKTIEIKNFNLVTEGIPVWFMIGKEIVPNKNGLIVPLFDHISKQFDCDSLRNYYNETIVLRLPASIEITDVFWLSVFSISNDFSMSQIFLPYNQLHPPPDLLSVDDPICQYSQ